MTEPASIRYKNPGAMWGKGNPVATKWGAGPTVTLNDGLGQSNNIAVFPTYVQGICAQIDLWRTSAHYKNKPFAEGIATWSGHNSVESYVSLVTKRVPGMTRNTIMNDAFWRSQMCIPFLKAQAFHEAGREYPAPDADWAEAQKRVLGGIIPAPVPAKPKNTARNTTTAIGGAATIGAMLKVNSSEIAIVILITGIVVMLGVHFLWPKAKP